MRLHITLRPSRSDLPVRPPAQMSQQTAPVTIRALTASGTATIARWWRKVNFLNLTGCTSRFSQRELAVSSTSVARVSTVVKRGEVAVTWRMCSNWMIGLLMATIALTSRYWTTWDRVVRMDCLDLSSDKVTPSSWVSCACGGYPSHSEDTYIVTYLWHLVHIWCTLVDNETAYHHHR